MERTKFSKEFQAIVVDNYGGFPMKVTFLGDRWWVTSPNEVLQPLDDYLGGDDNDFTYLCEAGSKVGALALASMLGKALEDSGQDIRLAMRQRVESLKRVGVELDYEGDTLSLEQRVFSNKSTFRQGKFSVWCYVTDDCYDPLFDVDGFDTQADAESWADCLFEFLREIGIDFNLTKVVRE